MTSQHYFSFIEQTLHYFDRPHEALLSEPLNTPSAWRGADLPTLEDMAHRLSESEIADIEIALTEALASGKPVRALTAADFPLPSLAEKFVKWRETLSTGRGFVVLRGAPVQRWTREQSECFFWCFGLHLGRPGEQNPDGDLLGHVIDLREKVATETTRLYKTAANIDYHCDAADVVGLLCLKRAKRGGQSRIVSSVSVFNELVTRRPDLAPRLFEPVALDVRDKEVNEAGSSLPIPPCRYAGGQLRTFYHADYFRSASRHDDVPELTARDRKSVV